LVISLYLLVLSVTDSIIP